uniref:HAT C-terminal dimerisation domain-containing protein n=1 Tax=Lactuca sativa TaxID=4236 RepID=A0A9R1W9I6_LACSA|nr:hypothetical protein LSAT_V11C300145690 [Lactuca sativa]
MDDGVISNQSSLMKGVGEIGACNYGGEETTTPNVNTSTQNANKPVKMKCSCSGNGWNISYIQMARQLRRCLPHKQHKQKKNQNLLNFLPSDANMDSEFAFSYRLHKRVLSFMHFPPPCIEWEIEDKIFTILIGNVAYNDRTIFSMLSMMFVRENMESVCDHLKVFKVCTNIITDSDCPTTNLYLIEVLKVKQTLDKCALSHNDFIHDMGECHLVIAIAFVLDPQFKMKLVEFSFPTIYQNPDKNIRKVKNIGMGGIWIVYKECRFRVTKKWWNVHKLKYHVLSMMARDLLVIPISNVAFEATFSAKGRVIDPYRASLAQDIVQMLIFEGDWIRHLHGIKRKLKKEESPTERPLN